MLLRDLEPNIYDLLHCVGVYYEFPRHSWWAIYWLTYK